MIIKKLRDLSLERLQAMSMHSFTILEQKITPHLQRLMDQGSLAIEKQFKEIPLIGIERFSENDPLGEESKYSPLKGIVHKFSNRVLWKVSYRCAAHCQFCTRVRQIGNPEGDLSKEDIQRALDYIREHSEVDDVILSGGDPLLTPQVTIRILDGLVEIPSIKMIRIGTRLPIHAPSSFKAGPVIDLLQRIREITKRQPMIVLVHINHPDELSREVADVIGAIKSTGAIVMTQTVFLNGINDDVEVLSKLFKSIYHLGMIPYYIYHCDSVRGLERFVVPLEKERQIITELRRNLSGIGVPKHAIDVPGKGKIDIPQAFWENIDLSSCSDYEGTKINLTSL